MIGELLDVRAIGVGDVDFQAVFIAVAPHDFLAVGRVARIDGAERVGAGGQLLDVAAVGVHLVDAEAIAVTQRREQDLSAVGRPRGVPAVVVADLLEIRRRRRPS